MKHLDHILPYVVFTLVILVTYFYVTNAENVGHCEQTYGACNHQKTSAYSLYVFTLVKVIYFIPSSLKSL